MIAALTRVTFSILAASTLLKRAASAVGMRGPRSPARRVVAGERREDAIDVAAALEARGLASTLDLLGEGVTSTATALDAARAYVDLIAAAAAANVSRSVSVKLTQIGLDIDRATAIDNLRRIVDAAVEPRFFVRVDMEGSDYTEDTLTTVHTLRSIGYENVGVAIQAALRRSAEDVSRLNDVGMSVRLVKGAYREPRRVAFVREEEVVAAFKTLAERLLVDGHQPAFATHDPALIDFVKQKAAEHRVGPERFEFEFLFGIRRDLQLSLAREGHRVRVYVPYGREWFPYFMRRLGERPANVWFVVKNLFSERAET